MPQAMPRWVRFGPEEDVAEVAGAVVTMLSLDEAL
jgi:hypothetical protein